MSFFSDLITGEAANATQSALDTVTAKPFNVVISIDHDTQVFLSVLTLVGMICAALIKKGSL